MNKNALIDALAAASGQDKVAVKAIIEALPGVVLKGIKQYGKVALPDFINVTSAVRSARDGRNPMTGEKISIPEKTVPKFTASKYFKDNIEGEDADNKAA